MYVEKWVASNLINRLSLITKDERVIKYLLSDLECNYSL
jgi:hypothetical protein